MTTFPVLTLVSSQLRTQYHKKQLINLLCSATGLLEFFLWERKTSLDRNSDSLRESGIVLLLSVFM